MRLPQQPPEPLHENLFEVFGIIGLALAGMIMVFLGWLKYRDRNKPSGPKSRKRAKDKTKQK
ncbi:MULTISPECIES: hypothetical protein [Massilia]|jgi:hypothetical protein|uniref:hypothetical protein n=1 Tax=Massilia TaxID=149698 RepID=UPI0004820374|nr:MULTISPECIES: hypothetical protein [Massilia]MDK6076285.1 hypothetical protein [Massilia varians]